MSCTKSDGSVGDSSTQGTCNANEFCNADGSCSACSSVAGGLGTKASPHAGCTVAARGNDVKPNCVSGTCYCVGTSADTTTGTGDGTSRGSCNGADRCHSDGGCSGICISKKH